MERHYTYKLIHPDTFEFYIGVRSCKCDPIDDKYKGSMRGWKLSNNEKQILDKHIYMEFKTREEAEEWEALAIYATIKDQLNRNYHIPTPGVGFTGYGVKRDEEFKRNVSLRQKGRIKSKMECEKISKAKKGKKLGTYSEEHKEGIRKGLTGLKHTEERKKNNSLAQLKVQSYECEICGKICKGKGNLKQHKNKHL